MHLCYRANIFERLICEPFLASAATITKVGRKLHRRQIVHMSWFQDESLWRDLYPFLFGQERFASAPEEVDRIVALTGVASGAVLDLCCGPGRHAAAFARSGFAVTGVDLSGFLLEKAREYAGSLPVEFVQSDMRAFARPHAFDLIVSLYTSFGYFDDPGEDLQLLNTMHANLRGRGVLVVDVLGKELIAAQPCATRWVHRDEEIFVDHHEIGPDWSHVRIKWLLIHGDCARHFDLRLNLYSGAELRALLTRAGFQDVTLFGSFAGAAYDPAARRLIAVARK
jgi:SAM-dependent methyltransferase